MSNADTVLKKYQETGLELDTALTQPWESAAEAMEEFGGPTGLGIMNDWTKENGYFDTFKIEATDALVSPWQSGTEALNSFQSSVSSAMGNVLSDIQSNVTSASSSLDTLYAKIQDTNTKVASVGDYIGGGSTGDYTVDVGPQTTSTGITGFTEVRGTLGGSGKSYSYKDANMIEKGGYIYIELAKGQWIRYDYAGVAERKNAQNVVSTLRNSKWSTDKKYAKYKAYAKGTTGTKKDEWAITDESWIGDEITLGAGKTGRLQYLRKGSAVLPSDISENLMEWGKLSPKDQNASNNVGLINNNLLNSQNEFNINIDGSAQDNIEELSEQSIRSLDGLQKSINYTDTLIKKTAKDSVENSISSLETINDSANAYRIPLGTDLASPWIGAAEASEEYKIDAKSNYNSLIQDVYEKTDAVKSSLSSDINNAQSSVSKFINASINEVNTLQDKLANEQTGLIKTLKDTTKTAQETKQTVESALSSSANDTSSITYNPQLGVEQWRPIVEKALKMEGQYSESNVELMLMQMNTESSGNPKAINDWDINAKNGTPSKGLMQVIDPTFQAYARPGYNTDIYDPLSNCLAAIRYTVSRYGSLSNGWHGHGYAKGTTGTKKDEIALTDEYGPELTLVPTKAGNLSFMRAGTGVVPADLTKELMKIGAVGLDGLMNANQISSGVNMISNAINKPEYNFSFENLLHIDNCTEETLPEVKKLVQTELNSFMRKLNYKLKTV